MLYAIFFITDHCIKVDIFHTVKDIGFNVWIVFLQRCNQLLCFQPFG